MAMMVRQVVEIEFIVTDTEAELQPKAVQKASNLLQFSEMLGESITLYGLFLYVAKRLLEKEPLSCTVKR